MAAIQLSLFKGIDPTGTDRDAPQLLDLVERVTGCGAWLLTPSDRRMALTDRLAAMLKRPRTAARSISLDEALGFYAPESRAAITAAFNACLAQAAPLNLESELVTYTGERLWVRTIGRAVRDRAGALVRVQGMVQDLTEKRRAEQENLNATLRLSLTLASVTIDRAGRFTFVNRESERLLRRSSAELLGHAIWEELAAEDASRLRRELRTTLGTGHGVELELYFPELGKWLELRAYPFEEGLAVYLRDVTALRQAREQSLLLQTSINRLNDIVLIAAGSPLSDPEPHIVFVNDAFERHTGFSRAEVLGQTPRMLAGPVTQRNEIDRIAQALSQPQSAPVRSELILYKKNGERFWTELEIVGVEYFSPDLTHWIAVARDITERKRNEGEIEHLAFYDALTQLPNRQLLMSRLRHALAQRDGVASVGALMFVDLDHFKLLNDSMGHYRGDMLLRHAATRLHNCVGAKDTVARLGGDEFVVMLQDLGESVQQATDQAREVGQRILQTLGEPYDLAGYAYHGTCSIGITAFGQQELGIEDLLKQADLAMYQAKAAGRNTMCFFDPEMQALATANAALTGELRQALRQREFVLYYQPQVGRDGRMLGVEALVRWQHPRRGLVNPDDFIPQAEESGLILPLGEWVIEAACAQLASWAGRPETEHLSISVNVSARQFGNADFVDQVMRVIETSGVRADRLELELTESLLATGMEVTIAKMGVLKAAGVTLAIDDFGMGYSALSYLKRLPLDQLKIDRSFVRDMLSDPNDAAIARTIIGLAQSLGLSVIAEGVETEAQRDLLARYGCHGYQGHLFGPALPIDELEAYIRAQTH
ncbi:MAG: diguanylate cyclase/phosphodiesterase (GGDEF & EAL domains) with PAS/PAC sensor(s) [Burkholderiaceae bacterium]|jgi:diguanylate cyclase (GGDEF)-like protein/PAS domain S-box-containing protein|nr:MAG: diguanylate cyclase/phosphodiesterase (GGDEF & EAL domains) with PAS/PAC sensor(s) [Burkholderiaceae bacterium]